MAQSSRLSKGGRIDRSAPLQFVFDGKAYTGFRGDTLACDRVTLPAVGINEHLLRV